MGNTNDDWIAWGCMWLAGVIGLVAAAVLGQQQQQTQSQSQPTTNNNPAPAPKKTPGCGCGK